ncbi:hypothetical protein DL98DRAFT_532115 [Cadophora sp. DSE1049]|nr:hypothetical protein DL98DRAFT_532115 [Cadophora sp. DSE1049]
MQFSTTILLLLGTALVSAEALSAVRGPHPVAGKAQLSNVHARSCAVRDYGCENGYCWQKCKADGSWCWMALLRGTGGWLTCLNDKECGPDPWGMRDASCAECDSSVCGCSC